ncbi:MAG: geranylgeranyl reductase family protein [Candidatus Helarchaeota archaeon]
MKYDVVIVGAGPSGSTVAQWIAKKGGKVLIIEKQKKPGNFIHCAGGIIGSVLERFNLLNYLKKRDVIKSNIYSIKFISPNNEFATFNLNRIIGHVIDRSKFDQSLAELAVDYGAELLCNSRFIQIKRQMDNEIVISIKQNRKLETIKTKILVGADGIKSRVAQQAGIFIPSKYFGYGYCFDLNNVSNVNKFEMEVIFSELTPGGYTWIFPKSDHSVNFGCGGIGKSNFYYKKVFQYFLKRFPIIKKRFKKARIVKFTGGVVPILDPPKSCVKHNILLVGDAANQINSTTAEGIRFSLICGKIAGLVINRALETKLSFVNEFDKYWKMKLGHEMLFSRLTRKFFFRFNDFDYNLIIKAAKNINFENIMLSQWIKVIKDIIFKTPSTIQLINSRFRKIRLPK